MKLIKIMSIILAGFIACSCSPQYRPAGKLAGGYSDTRIDDNTALISYRTNTQISDTKSKSFLLRRSAEVTLQAGYDYFIIESTSTKVVQNTNTMPGNTRNPTVVVTDSKGATKSYNADVYTANQSMSTIKYQTNATIKMYKGTKPKNNKKAYNAQDVLSHNLNSASDSSIV